MSDEDYFTLNDDLTICENDKKQKINTYSHCTMRMWNVLIIWGNSKLLNLKIKSIYTSYWILKKII